MFAIEQNFKVRVDATLRAVEKKSYEQIYRSITLVRTRRSEFERHLRLLLQEESQTGLVLSYQGG
jgi:hypothetical protein